MADAALLTRGLYLEYATLGWSTIAKCGRPSAWWPSS